MEAVNSINPLSKEYAGGLGNALSMYQRPGDHYAIITSSEIKE